MHLEAVLEWGWRCAWRPWWREIGVQGGDQSGGSSLGGRRNGSWDSIHWLACIRGNIGNRAQHGLPKDERLAGSGRQSILGWCNLQWVHYSVYVVLGVYCTWCMLYLVYAVLGVCCTWCMLYSVYIVLGVCCTRCMLYSVYAVLGVCCTRCMLYSVYAVLDICCTRCMLYSVYAVLGVCCTRCMLYSVNAVLGICCNRCHLLVMAWRNRVGWLTFIFLGDGRFDDDTERDERRLGKSWWEIGTQTILCASQFTIPDRAGIAFATGASNPPAVRVQTGNIVRFGSWPIKNPNCPDLVGLSPGLDINAQFSGQVYPTAEPHLRELTTFAPIQYLSCDRVTIWHICTRCSFRCCSPLILAFCDLITLHWVDVE